MKNSFPDFMKANYNIFMSYCRSRGQPYADSDEIVSEAFARLWSKWDERSGAGEALNKKWMYNAIGYIILERQRRPENQHRSENLDDFAELLSDGGEIDELVNYKELVGTIEKALSGSDRELFRLVYIKRANYPEIAEQLNISSQALRTRISRLKDRIEKILKNQQI